MSPAKPPAKKAAAKGPSKAPAKAAAKAQAKPEVPKAARAPDPAKRPAPKPMAETPAFVREASPTERKAALESIIAADPVLRAPVPTWRRAESPIAQPLRKQDPIVLPPKPAPAAVASRRTVLLDTNALMMQFQFHIDIENELKRVLDFAYEIVVPSTVKDELTALASEGAGKDAVEARLALELAKTFKELPSGPGDPGILRLAEELGAIVVTNDKILRARLRAKDVPNVHMRSKAFLTLEGHIRGL